MILPILQEDNPVLRQKSEPIKIFDESLRTLIKNMNDTAKSKKAAGLAAPQIGVLKQVILVTRGNGMFRALINPTILEEKGSQLSTERCLSVNKTCVVKRPAEVLVQYQDAYGNLHRYTAKEFDANCMCHEIDHLNGVLISDLDISNKSDDYYSFGPAVEV